MTDQQKHAARLREELCTHLPDLRDALLAGAEALEAQGVKVTRVMDPEAKAYHERIAQHCDRLEAIQERIAKALEPKEQGEWRIMVRGGEPYLVPAADYKQAIESPDLIGSAVDASDVTVTGWRRT